MNILSAFIIFDVLIIIYELLIEIFSALYQLSGLTKEQARFQVTSLITGTGFTTAESEKMLETKKRKRVTRNIMIISYIFNISIISTLVTIATSTQSSNKDQLVIGLIASILIIIILFFSKKVNKIRNSIDKGILNVVGFLFYRKQNYIIVYDYYDKNALIEVKLNKLPKSLEKKDMEELKLKEKYNISVLSIKRKNKVTTKITKGTRFYKKDVVLMIGNKKIIEKIFGG